MGTQGLLDDASLLVGDWSYVGAIQSGVEYELGNVPEGVLTITRETYEHVSTAFPRSVDVTAVASVGMMFEGQVEEWHEQNAHFLVGDLLGNSSNYIYLGARKDCAFFTFSAKRERICDGRTIEAYMWKCQTMGIVQLGGGNESAKSPFQVTALADRTGDYGGSSTAPLGYLYVPDRLAP